MEFLLISQTATNFWRRTFKYCG